MKRFKRILCVVDPRQPADTVLERAVSLARNNQATLTVVCVAPRVTAGIGMPDGGPISAELQGAESANWRRQLENAVAPFRSRIPIDAMVLMGTVFLEVIREVLRHGHDLVIKAPEDPAWLDHLFGSDDMHLLRKCPCPVWIDRPGLKSAYRKILAAVDPFDDESGNLQCLILDLATSLAEREHASLEVIHAWELPGESTLAHGRGRIPRVEIELLRQTTESSHREALDKLLQPYSLTTGDEGVHLVKGKAAESISGLTKSKDIDLIVMGTLGRAGIAGLFIGNTAENVLRDTQTAVLTVKPDGFITPVQ